jgi:hypothetical protein
MTITLERELKKGEPPRVEAGLQGQLKKSQLPYMMGDLCTPAADKRGWWRNVDSVTVFYLTLRRLRRRGYHRSSGCCASRSGT